MAAPEHKVIVIPLRLGKSENRVEEVDSFVNQDGGFRDVPGSIDITSAVVQIATDKTLELWPGRFRLTLADIPFKKISYAQFLQPGDLILIELNAGERDDTFEPVMVGPVVRSSKATRVSGDRVTHYVEIHGNDLARWLQVDRIMFWAYAGLGRHSGIKELQNRQGKWMIFPNSGLPATAQSSTDILRNIFYEYIGKILPRIGEAIHFAPVKTQSKEAQFASEDPYLGLGERYVPMHDMPSFSGSAGNLLESHSMPYFSELWTDTTQNGRFAIYYRRPPFDLTDWYSFEAFKRGTKPKEPTRIIHPIRDSEVVSVSPGRSDDEYYNLISVVPAIYAANEALTKLVLDNFLRLDPSSIKDRGLRPLFIDPPYDMGFIRSGEQSRFDTGGSYDDMIKSGEVDIDNDATNVPHRQIDAALRQAMTKTGTVTKLMNHWVDTAWRWYSQLDRYYTGAMVIKGNPYVKVGHQVELISETQKVFRDIYTLYVVSVSQDYDCEDGSYLTTLRFARGQSMNPAEFILPVHPGIGTPDIEQLRQQRQSGRFTNSRPLADPVWDDPDRGDRFEEEED
jgi:hypothetical protein